MPPAVGLIEIGGREDGRGFAGGDETGFEQHGVFEMFTCETQIVDHGEHGAALRAPTAENVHEFFRRVDVESGKWFIEEENIGALRERAREEDALLLSAGKLADLARGEIGDVEFFQRAIDAGVIVT